MILPDVAPWVKQADEYFVFRINSRNIAALVPVTDNTGKSQIVGVRSPPMFQGPNVVDGMINC